MSKNILNLSAQHITYGAELIRYFTPNIFFHVIIIILYQFAIWHIKKQ